MKRFTKAFVALLAVALVSGIAWAHEAPATAPSTQEQVAPMSPATPPAQVQQFNRAPHMQGQQFNQTPHMQGQQFNQTPLGGEDLRPATGHAVTIVGTAMSGQTATTVTGMATAVAAGIVVGNRLSPAKGGGSILLAQASLHFHQARHLTKRRRKNVQRAEDGGLNATKRFFQSRICIIFETTESVRLWKFPR